MAKKPTKKQQAARRKFYVFACLLSALAFTSLLLLVLSPKPLRPDAVTSLFAVDSADSLDSIYRTSEPVKPGRWAHVFIRQSRTAGGNAATVATPEHGLADHFVICNGDGGADGELQVGQRWDSQQSAAPAPGIEKIDPKCVSICLVGDFDHGKPTAAQQRRLEQLLTSLRGRLDLTSESVHVLQSGEASIGRGFPLAMLRDE